MRSSRLRWSSRAAGGVVSVVVSLMAQGSPPRRPAAIGHAPGRPLAVPSSAVAKQLGEKTIADNRRARFDYQLLERVEAGIALTGTEVKSLRAGRATLA